MFRFAFFLCVWLAYCRFFLCGCDPWRSTLRTYSWGSSLSACRSMVMLPCSCQSASKTSIPPFSRPACASFVRSAGRILSPSLWGFLRCFGRRFGTASWSWAMRQVYSWRMSWMSEGWRSYSCSRSCPFLRVVLRGETCRSVLQSWCHWSQTAGLPRCLHNGSFRLLFLKICGILRCLFPARCHFRES